MSKSKKKTQTPISDREAIDREATLANRKFWTVRVDPGKPKDLGKHLPKGVVVMHNRGPGAVHVNTGYTNVEAILAPGDTDMIIVQDHLGFAIIDSKPAVLEFEFMLALN
jgi:hypothetical protein